MIDLQILFLIKIVYILAIAYIIGIQREASGKDLGFRSIALVMLGAFAFTYTAYNSDRVIDYHVIAQIVSGISFVGAGLIFKDKNVHNLTTAILVWVCAAMGVMVCLGMFIEVFVLAAITWLLLIYKKKQNEVD